MLADGVRNEAYWRAIEKYIRSEHVVLDVGTGTGMLALLAPRGARKKSTRSIMRTLSRPPSVSHEPITERISSS